jgi:hypothetical protein
MRNFLAVVARLAGKKNQGGCAMKIVRIAFVLIFVVISAKEAKIEMNASSGEIASERSKHEAPAGVDFPVCNTFPEPLKEKYVIAEGDSFVIGLQADCPPDSPSDAKFEFLQPPPRFVGFTAAYRGLRSALSLMVISPRRGDAGDYRINFSVSHCTGGAGCGFTGFRLKVKPAA